MYTNKEVERERERFAQSVRGMLLQSQTPLYNERYFTL